METVPDYSPAALVGQQSPGFDDNSLYDPTIVKKTDVPVGPDMFSNPLGRIEVQLNIKLHLKIFFIKRVPIVISGIKLKV